MDTGYSLERTTLGLIGTFILLILPLNCSVYQSVAVSIFTWEIKKKFSSITITSTTQPLLFEIDFVVNKVSIKVFHN